MSKPYIPNDKLSQKARKENYRARSVYKLMELDHKFRLIKPKTRVLDLAAAPGSWSQYCSEKIGDTGHVLGLDLQEIKYIAPNVTTAICDITYESRVGEQIKKLGWDKVDLILSDIAPSTTGIPNVDHGRSIELNTHIFELSKLFLKPKGNLVMKVFDGEDFTIFINMLKRYFSHVDRYKAKSSRERSKEIYVICS